MSTISLTEAKTLAKNGDPDTSHTAAAMLDADNVSAIKQAILTILHTGPKTVVQIAGKYFANRIDQGWPDCHPHSIARRLSELHTKDEKVIDTGYRAEGQYGRPIAIWALTGWEPNNQKTDAA